MLQTSDFNPSENHIKQNRFIFQKSFFKHVHINKTNNETSCSKKKKHNTTFFIMVLPTNPLLPRPLLELLIFPKRWERNDKNQVSAPASPGDSRNLGNPWGMPVYQNLHERGWFSGG